MRRVLAGALALSLTFGPAYAGPVSCSQTVDTAATAVPFPAGAGHGPSKPTVYLEMCNAHATNNLGFNWTGGAANIGAAGTMTLFPGGCKWLYQPAIPDPSQLSVVGSAASTTTACAYQ